jgi:hypothetical protein
MNAFPTTIRDAAWLPQVPSWISKYVFALLDEDTLMSTPIADPCLYILSPTKTYPLLRLMMRAASALFSSMPGGSF